MSASTDTPLTGFDLWTPNDYSNFITISTAAIGSTLLVIFKSRCKKISICCGLLGCDREVQSESDEENPPAADPPQPPAQPPPQPPAQPPAQPAQPAQNAP